MKATTALDGLWAATLLVLLPIAPLIASLISADASYCRRYAGTLVRAARHIGAQFRVRAFSRWIFYQAPPVGQRDDIVGGCTHCGNCCLHRQCVFLDWSVEGHSRCRIYGRSFWRLLACGRYPESALDISLYACPSFAAVPRSGPSRSRTIPIAVVETQRAVVAKTTH